jgi:hypothetical protein
MTRWQEEHPEKWYPESDSTLFVGICVGQISATAISLARSLTELLPLAVDAVRIAFHLGRLTTASRNDLEASSDDAWAIVIPRDTIVSTEDILDGIIKESVSNSTMIVTVIKWSNLIPGNLSPEKALCHSIFP